MSLDARTQNDGALLENYPYPSKFRLFQNPWLERTTHVHPATPFVIWGPVVMYLLWHAIGKYQPSLLMLLAHAALALFAWTFVEYVLHRFVFHYEFKSDFGKKVHFFIHGVHHDDPSDPTRLVMPPAASIVLSIVFYQLFRVLLPESSVDIAFAFFVVGYLIYDYTHYWTHHGKPRTEFGKKLKAHHLRHHFVEHDTRWGVSSPLWDFVFGTLRMPPKKDA